MTTEAITPLRQRMIEDMNARKLVRRHAATQEAQENSRERQRDEQHGAAADILVSGPKAPLPWQCRRQWNRDRSCRQSPYRVRCLASRHGVRPCPVRGLAHALTGLWRRF